jgi:hypothetical protein
MTPFLKRLGLLLCVLACFSAGAVYANCTNPAGVERDIVYNNDYHTYQFCNGTNWMPFGAISGAPNRSVVSGWPDAIVCNVTNPSWGTIVFKASWMPSGGYYYYDFVGCCSGTPPQAQIKYNPDGTFNAYTNTVVASSCDGLSITQLYANGQAFNFVVGP